MKKFLPVILSVFLVACGGGDNGISSTCEVSTISTGLDVVGTTDDAQVIINKGGKAFLALHQIYNLSDGTLLPNAERILVDFYSNNKNLLDNPKLYVLLADEPFWLSDPNLTKEQNRLKNYNNIIEIITLVNRVMPLVKVGFVANPEAWIEDPEIIPLLKKAVALTDWTSTDIYFFTTDKTEVENKLKAANDFINFSPNKQKFMAIQGFAPTNFGKNVSSWSEKDKLDFSSALNQLVNIGINRYNGVIIWGWYMTNEDQNLVFGRYFSEDLVNVYKLLIKKINGSCF